MLSPLLSQLKGYTPSDIAFITSAYNFAERAHQGQRRASGEPYLVHPLAAAMKLAGLHLDAQTIAAALLHDVLDDTPVSEEELKKEFGEAVTFLVKGVSRLGKIRHKHPNNNHAIRDETEDSGHSRIENIRNMMLATAEDIRVVLIKLADRLHNMETLEYLPEAKRRVIAQETIEIFAPLSWRLGMGNWAGALEDLAFPYIHPEHYRALQERVGGSYQEKERYLKELEPLIRAELAKEDIRLVEIHARPKHLYSVWRKLHRPEIADRLEHIHDLVALRLIVKTTEDCYAALGVIHRLFTPVPGRIKDYIALAKPNGYQSIHTTIVGPGGMITEIQIRTPEMHQEAEFGIAAHWAYKAKAQEGKETPPTRETATRWIKQLREWQHAKTTEEFLESLKIDVFRNRIFVFTPRGDVIDLPESATPVDFAYAIHSELGNECAGSRVNGKIATLNAALHNGDRVEILRQKKKKPSPDWLKFVKTTLARDHIKAALKDRPPFGAIGRRLRSALSL